MDSPRPLAKRHSDSGVEKMGRGPRAFERRLFGMRRLSEEFTRSMGFSVEISHAFMARIVGKRLRPRGAVVNGVPAALRDRRLSETAPRLGAWS